MVVADLRSKERGVERGESHTEKERRDKSLVRERERERERKKITNGWANGVRN